MATVEQSLHESTRAPAWFLEFLKRELAPYPGRTGIVVRMLVAATLVMIICETFRIPYAFEGVIYTLIISRKSPQATLQSAGTTLLFVGIGGAYVLISAGFVISVPILHFLWVIGSFLLTFYALSAMTNYGASSTFALVVAVGIPIWERHLSAETNVADTLWLTLAVSVGALVTATVELAPPRFSLLNAVQNRVSLAPQAFTNSASTKVHLPLLRGMVQWKLLAPDAFVNPEHLKFAIRGCLAASGCYIIYNSIAWPGIGAPAIATCLLTAVSVVGASSQQRQILRFAAFVVGGLLIGIGSEMFILPHLDSIVGFTIFFVVVMALVSWFMTSSPRFSYFGFQIAVVFSLINLQEFARQTSLAAARDRIVGAGLGLCMMWLVFDRLWTASIAVE
jgi:Fusaric acid resistance protein family